MHGKQPNTNHCHYELGNTNGDFLITPSSNHPGGVHTLLADGHTEFVDQEVDLNIWWALGSRNGEDLTGEF